MINAGHPLDLETAEILARGHVRHGIARGSTLRRLDNAVESYPTSTANGETLVYKQPGLPDPPTWPETGRALRKYALISGARGMLYSKNLAAADAAVWLYRDAAGRRWLARVSTPLPSTAIDAAATSLSVSVVFQRFGDFGVAPASITRTHSLSAAAIFGDDRETIQGGIFGSTVVEFSDIPDYRLRLEDTTRTGAKALFSWTHARQAFLDVAAPSWYHQRNAVAFAEMSVSLAGDDMPDFTLAAVADRSDVLPLSTYTGPADGGTGCPFGPGSRRFEIVDRVVGGCYADDGSILWAKISWRWDYVVDDRETIIETAHVYPWPPAPPYNDTASANATAYYTLAFGAHSVTVNASESRTVTVNREVGSVGYPLTISGSTVFGSDSVTFSGGGGGGAGCSTHNTGDPENDPFVWHCHVSAEARATHPFIQPLCPAYLGNPDDGEYPHGLTPAISIVGLNNFATAAIVRLSACLWGILHLRNSGDLWLDALIGPGGAITSYTKVVACTVGAGDPDCLTGGYKYVAGSLGNLGAISVANLRGSHNRETGETVIATDGVAVCFV